MSRLIGGHEGAEPSCRAGVQSRPQTIAANASSRGNSDLDWGTDLFVRLAANAVAMYGRAFRALAWDIHEVRHRPPLCRPGKSRAQILEIANAVEPIQGRIHIEKINEPFLFRDGGSPAEYGAGLKLAIERGWLRLHESGTFVTFTPAGAELFA